MALRSAAILCLGALLASCEDQRECPAIGCGAVYSVDVPLPSQVEGTLTIEACFNDECGSVEATPPFSPYPDPGVGLSLRISTPVEAVWMDAALYNTPQMTISYYVLDSVPVAAGDRIATRVMDAEGLVVAQSVVLVESYGRSHPNGEGCGDGCLFVDRVED